MRHAWVENIHTAQNAPQLRAVFNQKVLLLDDKEVQDLFFHRIKMLKAYSFNLDDIHALDLLKEDIEHEIHYKTKAAEVYKSKKEGEVAAQVKHEVEKALREIKKEEARKEQLNTTKNIVVARKKIITPKDGYLKDLDYSKLENLYFKIEKELILKALHFHKGNRTLTSKSLGIHPRTLRHKIREYGKEAEQ